MCYINKLELELELSYNTDEYTWHNHDKPHEKPYWQKDKGEKPSGMWVGNLRGEMANKIKTTDMLKVQGHSKDQRNSIMSSSWQQPSSDTIRFIMNS